MWSAIALVCVTGLGALLVRRGFPLPDLHGRAGCVDGLRGYLALLVMCQHFVVWFQLVNWNAGWRPPIVNLFVHFGATSVALFFMTTGMLFYPKMLSPPSMPQWVTLYITRFFRIVPLILVSVAVIWLIIWSRTGAGLGLRDFRRAAAWAGGYSQPDFMNYPNSSELDAKVLWSIGYEWCFYLVVLPLGAVYSMLVRGRLPSWTLPAAVTAVAAVGQLLMPHVKLFGFLPLFAGGMIAVELRDRPRVRAFLVSAPAAIAAAIGLAVTMIWLTSSLEPASLLLLTFFFACVAAGNSFGGVFVTRGARLLGEISYSIYVLHGIVLSLAFIELGGLTGRLSEPAMPVLLPVFAIVVTLLCCASYLGIERTFNTFGRQLAKRITHRRPHLDVAQLEVAP